MFGKVTFVVVVAAPCVADMVEASAHAETTTSEIGSRMRPQTENHCPPGLSHSVSSAAMLSQETPALRVQGSRAPLSAESCATLATRIPFVRTGRPLDKITPRSDSQHESMDKSVT